MVFKFSAIDFFMYVSEFVSVYAFINIHNYYIISHQLCFYICYY